MPQLKVLHYLSDDVYNNGEPYLIDSDWITKPQTLTSFPVGLKIKYKCKEGIFSAKIDEQTCPLEEEQTSQSSSSEDDGDHYSPPAPRISKALIKTTAQLRATAKRKIGQKVKHVPSIATKPFSRKVSVKPRKSLKIVSVATPARVDVSAASNSELRVARSPFKLHKSLLSGVSDKIRQFALSNSIATATQTDSWQDVDMQINFDKLSDSISNTINNQFTQLNKTIDTRFRELHRGHLMSQITKTSTTCARNQSAEEQKFPIVTALEDENLPTCSSYLNNTSGQETNAFIEPSIIDPTFDMAIRPVPPDDYFSSLLAHSLPVNLTPQPGKQQKLSKKNPGYNVPHHTDCSYADNR